MAEDLLTYFDELATSFADSPQAVGYMSPTWFRFEQKAILRWLSNGSKDEEHGCDKILDVGCGIGLFIEPLVARHFVVGLDISLAQLQGARRRGIAGVAGNGFRLPFRTGFFDKVLFIEVLQQFHPQQGADLIRELARMVAMQGELVIAVRNKYSLARALFSPARRILRRRRPSVFGYQPDWLREMFKSLGFTDIQIASVFPPLKYFQIDSQPARLARYIGSSFVIRGKKQFEILA